MLSIVLSASLSVFLSACASTPGWWKPACADEAIAVRMKTVAPAGLVYSNRDLISPPDSRTILNLLAAQHAAWVETAIWPRPSESRRPGVYAIRLGDLGAPACAEALYRHRLAADGVGRITRTDDDADRRGLPPPLDRCLTFERIGDLPEGTGGTATYEGPIPWTAPFEIAVEGGPDPRGAEDFRAFVTMWTVRDRSDGAAIWRTKALSLAPRRLTGFPWIAACRAAEGPPIFGVDTASAPSPFEPYGTGGPSRP